MNIIQFQSFWDQHFLHCPPVSYLFKYNLPDRWFRFHSLPNSKRYADDEIEMAELLMRQNKVLLDVIGNQSPCILVSGVYVDLTATKNIQYCPALAEFEWQKFLHISKQDFDPDESYELDEEPILLRLSYSTHLLKYGSLDGILRCIADENTTNFFIVSCERQRIFAPYDGGVDMILKDTEERDVFKTKYSAWLSKHPESL